MCRFAHPAILPRSAPTRLAEVKITQAQASEKSLKLAVTLLDDKGAALSGAVPLKITLKGAGEGGASEFTLYRATSEGVLETEIPLSGAVPRPSSVAVQEFFSGQSAEARP